MKKIDVTKKFIKPGLLFLCGFLFITVIVSGREKKESQPGDEPPDVFKQNERLGKGGNFGNILYDYETWDKQEEVHEFDLMREIGLDNVRINIGPFNHCSQQPPYTLDEDFLERVDWTVRQAIDHDLTVIIDQHEYHAMADDPIGRKEMFLATWDQMARHYKDYPDNVYFGVLNEPNGNLTSYLWNYFLIDAISVIRVSNPGRTLVIGPGRWNSIGELENLELPEDDRNIIVEIHYYSPHHFTHQGTSWSEGSDAWLGTTWRGTPEEKQAVLSDFQKAVDWGNDHNRPLYLGEFGVYRKADMESRATWDRFIVQTAEANNISWSIWDLMGNSFGIYDRDKKEWITPLKNAILQNE